MKSWFPSADIREIADHDRVNNLGIFDITVNGVLIHSRKCDTRTYGVLGHLWLRDEPTRQNAVWHALDSVQNPVKYSLNPLSASSADKVHVVILSSSRNVHAAAQTAATFREYFQDANLQVEERFDDGSDWNFEIFVNGVLLHSMSRQWHRHPLDDPKQHSLLQRAISDLLLASRNMATVGA